MNTIQQAKEIFGENPGLEDLFRVAEEKGYNITLKENVIWFTKDNKEKRMEIISKIPFLEQPNLEEILNFFK